MVRKKPTLWAPQNPLPLAGPIVPTEENARQPNCTWTAFTAKFPGLELALNYLETEHAKNNRNLFCLKRKWLSSY